LDRDDDLLAFLGVKGEAIHHPRHDLAVVRDGQRKRAELGLCGRLFEFQEGEKVEFAVGNGGVSKKISQIGPVVRLPISQPRAWAA